MKYIIYIFIMKRWWGEGWLGFPYLWSDQKPWWNWYLTPVVNFGEVRRAQLAKYTLLPPRWRPWDLFRSFKVYSDAKERVGCGKKREATASIYPRESATVVPEFAVEDLPLDRTSNLVPALAVKDLPLGRTQWWWWW